MGRDFFDEPNSKAGIQSLPSLKVLVFDDPSFCLALGFLKTTFPDGSGLSSSGLCFLFLSSISFRNDNAAAVLDLSVNGI